jgi:hypothetical protein
LDYSTLKIGITLQVYGGQCLCGRLLFAGIKQYNFDSFITASNSIENRQETILNFLTLTLKAITVTGRKFLHWEGASNSTDEEITISLTGNTGLTAVFENTNSINSNDITADDAQIKL